MSIMDYSPSDIQALAGSADRDGFGGGGWWILLLFILMGGWGNNRGYGGGYQGGAGGDMLYPWLNQAQTQWQGISQIQQDLCNGFANAESAAAARAMANSQQLFGLQTAMMQGFNGQQAQLAQCCCDNRMATADLKYTVASEACAGRNAAMMNTRDILANQDAKAQMIVDKLCALELEGVKNQLEDARRENISLQNQLNMSAFRESQANQNSLITQGFSNEVDALYNRLSNCPVPTTPVYGRTPIFTCGNQGCGCGVAA